MFSTDGADVFTDQRTVTISSRGSSLPIQHRVQSQGSSVHIPYLSVKMMQISNAVGCRAGIKISNVGVRMLDVAADT